MEETTVVKRTTTGRRTTGRRKIEIKKIEEKNKLQVTFSKRRKGLFKKAAELSVLCGADVAILVQSPAGKVFGFGGRASIDTIIDRYLAGKASEKSLMQNKGDNSKGFWWEQPIDNLDLEELLEYKAAMEILRKNVLARADEIAAAAANNIDAAKNNVAANNNSAANNNAESSSGLFIPNVAVDSFGGLPVIHCESDDSGGGDDDDEEEEDDNMNANVKASAVENLNVETNRHQPLMLGNPKLESTDDSDVLFMFENPNPEIDINRPLMLTIPKLEIVDSDQPLMFEIPSPETNNNQLLMSENPNPQTNSDQPLVLENPITETNGEVAEVSENPNPPKTSS
ncbi:unnamed protein product [Coffea canephora]|uniref:MADS-box domain-containing protein n=1 Tax=Coffea canephora TaxID=49390 RepID=A0A068UDR5_COFCA|nr:unnamed protein product [Coffea canephora]